MAPSPQCAALNAAMTKKGKCCATQDKGDHAHLLHTLPTRIDVRGRRREDQQARAACHRQYVLCLNYLCAQVT